jgi:hypothetical protein
MKKMIIFVLGGLFVGIGGGSFIRGTRERDIILERMAAEQVLADSISALEAGLEAHGGPAAAEEQAPDAQAQASDEGHEPDSTVVADSGHVEAPGHQEADEGMEQGDLAEAQPPVEVAGTAPGPEGPTSEPQEEVTGTEAPVSDPAPTRIAVEPVDTLPAGPVRMAKIFGAMEPKDAAAVMENLSDKEIQSILNNMSDRKVAAILEEFAPERAASLSRIVLADRSGTDR